MYSRYLPPEEAFRPLPPEEQPPAPPPRPEQRRPSPPGRAQNNPPPGSRGPAGELLGGVTQELNRLLGGFLHFCPEELDTGDILLALIVLFLFLEGDDLDLAIALGLTLLLSLGESAKPPPDAAPSRPEG